MKKRVKTGRIVIRVGEIEKRTIQGMADKEGLSLSDFVLARVWGEVPERVETPHAVGPAEASSLVSLAPGASKVAELKAKLGLVTGSDLLAGRAPVGGGLEVAPAPKPRRGFNCSRPGWYEPVVKEPTFQILRDIETGQVWLHFGGPTAREFPTVEAARAFAESQ
jgi:hypothetical protein